MTVAPGTTVGVLGRSWRATVTPWGDVQPWDASPTLAWFVAAEDRWHRPAEEVATRQQRVDGTPVVETRVRVPGGDVVGRVWAVADGPGYTVMELENDSPRSVAVALTRRDVLTSRPPADVPVEGIELPATSMVLPIGHRTSVRVAMAHDGSGAGLLPGDLPGPVQVARGWLAVAERASRLVLPDTTSVAAAVAARCEVALAGPGDPGDDPVGFVLGVHELVRMGDPAEGWVPDVASATESLLRQVRRAGRLEWDADRALLAAAAVLHAAGEDRAVADVVTSRLRLGERAVGWAAGPEGVRAVAGVEGQLAAPSERGICTLLPGGVPAGWLGASFEAYHLPAGPAHTVSYAVRWHGTRPAVLWEVHGGPGLVLRSGADSAWHTSDAQGEALWRPSADV
jgi:hypothetical protein